MNRILLVPLALALASAGCNSRSCDATDLTFFWRFAGAPIAGQQRIAGSFTAADNGCAAAGIDAQGIDVFIGGERFAFDCGDQNGNVGVPGVTFAGTLRGSYDWRIDAYRGGQLAFSQSGTVDARSCGPVAVDADLQAVTPQPMVVYYDVNGQPPTGCFYTVPIANVPFELRNGANQIVDASCVARNAQTGDCTTEGTNACDAASLGFVTRSLPLGVYTMSFLELWDAAGNPLATACNRQVVHDGLPTTVDLAASGGAFCAVPPPNAVLASDAATP